MSNSFLVLLSKILGSENPGSGKPTMVLLNTVKGCGVSFVEAMGASCHNANSSWDDAQRAIAEIRGE